MMIKYGVAKIVASYENSVSLLESFPNLEKSLESFKAIKLDPERYMYVRNRSISCLETWGANKNGDGFPRLDVKKAHHTFINSRVSVDHQEDIIVGVVIDSYFVEPVVEYVGDSIIKRGDYVENILALDKKVLESYKPDGVNSLYKLIMDGIVEDTSMGAIVGYSICSVPTCMNIARSEDEYCEHIKTAKNTIIRVGGVLDVPVYEICKEITFFEDSIIVPIRFGGKAGGEGADPYARMLEKIATTPLRSYVVYRDRIYKTSQIESNIPVSLLRTPEKKVIRQEFKDDDIEYTKKKLREKDDEEKVVVKKSQEEQKPISVAYDYLVELLVKGTPFDEALRLAWEQFKSITGEKKEAQKEKQDVIVADMDGTIVDISHRLHYIEKKPKDWDSFFSIDEIKKDKIRYDVVSEIKKLKEETKLPLIILTGRPESLREITEEQLKEAGLEYDELIMKPEKMRYDKAITFKLEVLEKYNPVYVFEDDKVVIEAIKSEYPDAKVYDVSIKKEELEEEKKEESEVRASKWQKFSFRRVI